MQPFQGSGAGQAIEVRLLPLAVKNASHPCTQDAYVLASLLGDAAESRMSVDAAIHLYDRIRRPVAQDVASRSRRAGMYYHLLIPPYNAAELPSHILHGEESEAAKKEKLGQLGDMVAWEWQWAWTREIGELDKDVDDARARL